MYKEEEERRGFKVRKRRRNRRETLYLWVEMRRLMGFRLPTLFAFSLGILTLALSIWTFLDLSKEAGRPCKDRVVIG